MERRGGGEVENACLHAYACLHTSLPSQMGTRSLSLLLPVVLTTYYLLLLQVLDGRAEAYAGQRGSLPAGLCSPVEALGESLVGQLCATAGFRLEVHVSPEAATAHVKVE